jgi:hypothetical protein
MKIISQFLYILFFSIVIASCDSFDSVDVRITNYVNEIEKNVGNMTANDWKEADLQMEVFQNELVESQMDLTEIQIGTANQAIGRYGGLRIKQGIGDFKNQLKDLGNQLEGVIDELTDTLNK